MPDSYRLKPLRRHATTHRKRRLALLRCVARPTLIVLSCRLLLPPRTLAADSPALHTQHDTSNTRHTHYIQVHIHIHSYIHIHIHNCNRKYKYIIHTTMIYTYIATHFRHYIHTYTFMAQINTFRHNFLRLYTHHIRTQPSRHRSHHTSRGAPPAAGTGPPILLLLPRSFYRLAFASLHPGVSRRRHGKKNLNDRW